MKIKKKLILDYIIIILMLLQLFILGFLGFNNILNKIVSLLIIVKVITGNNTKLFKLKGIWLLVLFVLSYLGNCVICGFEFSILKDNFLMLLYPLLYVYYFYELEKRNNDFFCNILFEHTKLYNVILIANIVVVLLQINRGVLIGVPEYGEIDLFLDQASGLFYYGGTHVLAMFTTFVCLLNFRELREVIDHTKRKALLFYNIMLIVISMWISTLNDNKAIFLLLFSFMGAYFIFNTITKKQAEALRSFAKYITYFFAFSVLAIVLYFINNTIKDYFDQFFIRLLKIIFDTSNDNMLVAGSNERIATVFYIFNNPQHLLFGYGMGKNYMLSANFLTFLHFGQASLGTLLVLGGISFTTISYGIFTYYLRSIVIRKKGIKYNLIILLLLIIVSVYNQCFFNPSLMLAVIMSFTALREPIRQI